VLEYSNEVVYEEAGEEQSSGDIDEFAELAAGDTYPPDSATLEADYQTDRETDDVELVYAKNPIFSYTAKKRSGQTVVDATLEKTTLELGNKNLRLLLTNMSADTVSLRRISVTAARDYYFDWARRFTDELAAGKEEDEIDGLYLADEDSAIKFIQYHRSEALAERSSIIFRTHIKLEPNQLVNLTELSPILLVRYRTYMPLQGKDLAGLYEYTCSAYAMQSAGNIRKSTRRRPTYRPQDGQTPQVQYARNQDPLNWPVDDLWFRFGNWFLSWAGRRIGMLSVWSTEQPQEESGWYVWMRTRISDGPWTYVRLTGDAGQDGQDGKDGDDGAPAIDFSLSAGMSTYAMSSRYVVKAAQGIMFACDRQNTTGSITWSVNRGLTIAPNEDGSTATVELPIDFGYTSFTVACSVAGVGTKTVQVNGVPSGTYAPMFLGKLETAPTTTAEGPLMEGDSYLTIGNVPWRWDGYSWSSPSTADANYASIMSQSLDAVLADGTDVTQSMASLYGYIRELVSKSAVIEQLFVKNTTVGNGDGTADSGFRFRAHQYGANGNILTVPIFDIMFGDKTVFKVVPSTGRIFLGQPNAAGDAPLAGFMYDPTDGAIRSVGDKVVIDDDGTLSVDGIIATGGIFGGTINATNGFFGGQCDTPAFSSMPGSGGSTENITLPTLANNQIPAHVDSGIKNTLTKSIKYPCTLRPMHLWRGFCITGSDKPIRTSYYTTPTIMKLVKSKAGLRLLVPIILRLGRANHLRCRLLMGLVRYLSSRTCRHRL
jgi:hypothetical protein